MSEIWTSLDFRHSTTVCFPNILNFLHVWNPNKNFGLKTHLWSENVVNTKFCVDFRHFSVMSELLNLLFRFQTLYVSASQTHKSSDFRQVGISDVHISEIYCESRQRQMKIYSFKIRKTRPGFESWSRRCSFSHKDFTPLLGQTWKKKMVSCHVFSMSQKVFLYGPSLFCLFYPIKLHSNLIIF